MESSLDEIKKQFVDSTSQISQFWGFPKGMGAIFGILYLSDSPLCLDEIVEQSGLTKGAVSTNVRALARLGLVHRRSKLGDRKDYYEAETDFWKALKSILKERENSEFDRSLRRIKAAKNRMNEIYPAEVDKENWEFARERIGNIQAFFDTLDSLVRAVSTLDKLGVSTVTKIIGTLK